MTSNQPDLDHLAALAAAATPGPWHLTDSSAIVAPLTGDEIADVWEPTAASRNGEFIEAAREALPALVAEVRRLRAELATARVQAIRDLADKADPQHPEISFFGDHGHEVGAWMRKQAEYEERRLAAEESHVVADDSDDPEHIDDRAILRAAPGNSDDWDDATWAAWWRTAERVHGDAPAAAGSAAANEDGQQ